MAQLSNKPCTGNWQISGSPDDWSKRQDAQMKALEAESARVAAAVKSNPKASLIGVLVYFPWADGSAVYRVSKDKPLMLEHVPYGDAWQVPYSQIRGLRRQDVLRQLNNPFGRW